MKTPTSITYAAALAAFLLILAFARAHVLNSQAQDKELAVMKECLTESKELRKEVLKLSKELKDLEKWLKEN